MANPIPLRTPFFDESGNISRPWVIYLQGLGDSGTGGSSSASTAWQIDLEVSGVLGIGSDQAPAQTLPALGTITDILASVKLAPIGAVITANILLGGVLLTTITVTAAATPNVPVEQTFAFTIAKIPPNIPVTLDITAVGTTLPGTRLTVTLRGTYPGASSSFSDSSISGGSGGGSTIDITEDGVDVTF